MFRVLFGLIAAIFMISALRAVIGSVARLFTSTVFSQSTPSNGPTMRPPTAEPASQVLRRCAQCGTFTPESTTKRVGKSEAPVYFCSAECLQKSAAKAS